MSTRTDILRAADELFGRVGFDAASVRDIAASSGVNKALIHYHFKSKDELFAAVLDSYYDALDALLRDALAAEGSPRERLARGLDAYVDFLAANQSFARMVQREASGGRHFRRIVERTLPFFQQGIALLRAAYPAGRRGDLAASQLLVSFHGMVVSYFTYAPVLAELTGGDPLARRSLERRKRHLRRMLNMVVDELESRA